uniref:Uncharacterized protein n=1 Tax=candidate division CPR3 bacterium TaxID=2268181 RepID=A0A7C4M0Z9_UNCC3
MLKEIAKVLIGALIAEMIFFVWLISQNILPVNFWFLEIGFISSIIIILTDFTLIILFSYYAWIRKPKIKKEKDIGASKNID